MAFIELSALSALPTPSPSEKTGQLAIFKKLNRTF
jgi:hypothetical protein